ncbi:uncharacterized protein LOC128239529 [Mya arenaria]|uniref:uncharacterized protein LOC128239529 n=1 Tax=Mya arenaria TaxID=6604 RepID=UPI0022E1A3C1|nr:uncharacterized protein LOC128239529 [Mya arenaria]
MGIRKVSIISALNRKLSLCTLVLLLLAGTSSGQKDCTMQDQCSCTMTDGSGIVDLTSLASKTDGQPTFKDVMEQEEGYYYSYSPCGSFSEVECKQATACVLDQNKKQSQQIGDSGRAAFQYDADAGNVVVAYTAGTGVLKLTTVDLICDESACDPTFTPKGEQGAGQFEMMLKTVCACPGKCDSKGPTGDCKGGSGASGGLSGGSILLIIVFGVLVSYLIGGILFMKFVKKAEGSEAIPNKGFWASIPRNVVNGCKFTVSKIRRKDVTYDQI